MRFLWAVAVVFGAVLLRWRFTLPLQSAKALDEIGEINVLFFRLGISVTFAPRWQFAARTERLGVARLARNRVLVPIAN